MKDREDFKACYEKGRKYHSRYFLLFFLPVTEIPSHDGTRIGIAAGRKIGNAVQRNRIKRLIRESFRLERSIFPANADIAIVAKRGIDPMKLQLADVQKDLRIIMHRICRDVNKHVPAKAARREDRSSGKPDT